MRASCSARGDASETKKRAFRGRRRPFSLWRLCVTPSVLERSSIGRRREVASRLNARTERASDFSGVAEARGAFFFRVSNPESAKSRPSRSRRSRSRRPGGCRSAEPPRERRMMTRSVGTSGPSSRTVEPCHTHVLAESTLGGGSASKSMTVVHFGEAVRKLSRVHLRQIPLQHIYSFD